MIVEDVMFLPPIVNLQSVMETLDGYPHIPSPRKCQKDASCAHKTSGPLQQQQNSPEHPVTCSSTHQPKVAMSYTQVTVTSEFSFLL